MHQPLARFAMAAALCGLFASNPMAAQLSPTTPKAAHIRIVEGPEAQAIREGLTVIRWTSDNPGGSPEHYGVVHYGTDPKNLNQTAKSPIRLNPGHSSTVFRVRMENLKPATTYYYTVGSMGADGAADKVASGIQHFKTP